MAKKSLVQNLISGIRRRLPSLLGFSADGSRDYYEALGYRKIITEEEALQRVSREDVAFRIAAAYPDATWSAPPLIREVGVERKNITERTPFEAAFEEVAQRVDLWTALARADFLASVVPYSAILLGFSGDLTKKPGPNNKTLAYISVFHSQEANIAQWDEDSTSENYGNPLNYTITPRRGSGTASTVNVHYSRIIHLAENKVANTVYGEPRLHLVWNRLDDLTKIVGGGAEMYWKGAFPGLSFEADAEAEITEEDQKKLETEISAYSNGLQRYLRMQGIRVNQLTPQIGDPSKHFDCVISMIAAGTGIPRRILLGSEQASLASAQDEGNWSDRVQERRESYAERGVLRPLIERLIQFNVLPKPEKGYKVYWPDTMAISAPERIKVVEGTARALREYCSSPGVEAVMPSRIFLQDVMQMPEWVIDAMDAMSKEEIDKLTERGVLVRASAGTSGPDGEQRASTSGNTGGAATGAGRPSGSGSA